MLIIHALVCSQLSQFQSPKLKNILLVIRVVKKCLWFRKQKFWFQYGSSKYAVNFAERTYQIWSNSLYILLLMMFLILLWLLLL